jgi:hypothetical protein
MARILSLFALSTLLTACGLDIAHDYGVIVSWLINGVAPSQDQCREHGVESVRFAVQSGDYAPLEGACGEGVDLYDGTSYGAFVTTDSFDYGRSYDYEQSMIDAKGRVVDGLTITGSFQGGYWDDDFPLLLDPLELFDPNGNLASFTAAWTVGNDTAQGCANFGISDVTVVLTTITDTDFVNSVALASAPCAAGQIASNGAVLAQGDYLMKLQARGSAGELVSEGDPIEALVDQAGEVTLDTVRFGL